MKERERGREECKRKRKLEENKYNGIEYLLNGRIPVQFTDLLDEMMEKMKEEEKEWSGKEGMK